LLDAEKAQGATGRCKADVKQIVSALPPARLAMPAAAVEKLQSACN
jgi:hypothetical protein